jgi:hypothetical protein
VLGSSRKPVESVPVASARLDQGYWLNRGLALSLPPKSLTQAEFMQLREIDKARYRQRYRIIFGAIVVALVVISLSTSALLISLFSTPEASHFSHNLAGVVIAAAVVSLVVYLMRDHPFLTEVVYVWNLKQQLNLIYRKQRHIEPKVEENDLDAMIIMNFMYIGSKQLYQLDDNTITMDDLALKNNALQARIKEAGVEISTDDYDPSMLERF